MVKMFDDFSILEQLEGNIAELLEKFLKWGSVGIIRKMAPF